MKDEDKKVKEREASKRHRKKKREEFETIVQQLSNLKLENDMLKREFVYRDPFVLEQKRREIIGSMAEKLENGGYPDKESLFKDIEASDSKIWEQAFAVSHLIVELGKALRPIMFLETSCALERLFAMTPKPFSALASENSQIAPEFKPMLQEMTKLEDIPEEMRQKLMETTMPYVDEFEKAQLLLQQMRGLLPVHGAQSRRA
mmetsp:Transcript_15365/g.25369  ORF Transcript_15365/g.25369 Transcript_15365/m.25369 type:complete len:203 (+) Transcript_15365:145-753(+)